MLICILSQLCERAGLEATAEPAAAGEAAASTLAQLRAGSLCWSHARELNLASCKQRLLLSDNSSCPQACWHGL